MSSTTTARLIAASRIVFHGKRLLVGEEFDATEQEARELVIQGHAKRKQKDARRLYKRRDMRAE